MSGRRIPEKGSGPFSAAEKGPDPFSEERGAALLLALLVLALMIVLVGDLSFSTKIDYKLARNYTDETQIDEAIRAGFAKGKAILRRDAKENKADCLHDLWSENGDLSLSLDEVSVQIEIVDEDRKWNLYWLNASTKREDQQAERERLLRLLEEFRDGTPLKLSYAEARESSEAIARYLKARKESKGSDEGDVPNPKTKGGHILVLGELLFGVVEDSLLNDFKDEEGTVIPGLENFVTIWSLGGVNINTADEKVLRMVFPPNRADLASAIISGRERAREEAERRIAEGGRGGAQPAPAPGAVGQAPAPVPAMGGGGAAALLGGGGAPAGGGAGKFLGYQNTSDLVRMNILDQNTLGTVAKYLTCSSEVFSIFVTARKGPLVKTARNVVRRAQNEFYSLLYEVRVEERPPREGEESLTTGPVPVQVTPRR
jgi:type II secretory pathway component PulK